MATFHHNDPFQARDRPPVERDRKHGQHSNAATASSEDSAKDETGEKSLFPVIKKEAEGEPGMVEWSVLCEAFVVTSSEDDPTSGDPWGDLEQDSKDDVQADDQEDLGKDDHSCTDGRCSGSKTTRTADQTSSAGDSSRLGYDHVDKCPGADRDSTKEIAKFLKKDHEGRSDQREMSATSDFADGTRRFSLNDDQKSHHVSRRSSQVSDDGLAEDADKAKSILGSEMLVGNTVTDGNKACSTKGDTRSIKCEKERSCTEHLEETKRKQANTGGVQNNANAQEKNTSILHESLAQILHQKMPSVNLPLEDTWQARTEDSDDAHVKDASPLASSSTQNSPRAFGRRKQRNPKQLLRPADDERTEDGSLEADVETLSSQQVSHSQPKSQTVAGKEKSRLDGILLKRRSAKPRKKSAQPRSVSDRFVLQPVPGFPHPTLAPAHNPPQGLYVPVVSPSMLPITTPFLGLSHTALGAPVNCSLTTEAVSHQGTEQGQLSLSESFPVLSSRLFSGQCQNIVQTATSQCIIHQGVPQTDFISNVTPLQELQKSSKKTKPKGGEANQKKKYRKGEQKGRSAKQTPAALLPVPRSSSGAPGSVQSSLGWPKGSAPTINVACRQAPPGRFALSLLPPAKGLSMKPIDLSMTSTLFRTKNSNQIDNSNISNKEAKDIPPTSGKTFSNLLVSISKKAKDEEKKLESRLDSSNNLHSLLQQKSIPGDTIGMSAGLDILSQVSTMKQSVGGKQQSILDPKPLRLKDEVKLFPVEKEQRMLDTKHYDGESNPSVGKDRKGETTSTATPQTASTCSLNLRNSSVKSDISSRSHPGVRTTRQSSLQATNDTKQTQTPCKTRRRRGQTSKRQASKPAKQTPRQISSFGLVPGNSGSGNVKLPIFTFPTVIGQNLSSFPVAPNLGSQSTTQSSTGIPAPDLRQGQSLLQPMQPITPPLFAALPRMAFQQGQPCAISQASAVSSLPYAHALPAQCLPALCGVSPSTQNPTIRFAAIQQGTPDRPLQAQSRTGIPVFLFLSQNNLVTAGVTPQVGHTQQQQSAGEDVSKTTDRDVDGSTLEHGNATKDSSTSPGAAESTKTEPSIEASNPSISESSRTEDKTSQSDTSTKLEPQLPQQTLECKALEQKTLESDQKANGHKLLPQNESWLVTLAHETRTKDSLPQCDEKVPGVAQDPDAEREQKQDLPATPPGILSHNNDEDVYPKPHRSKKGVPHRYRNDAAWVGDLSDLSDMTDHELMDVSDDDDWIPEKNEEAGSTDNEVETTTDWILLDDAPVRGRKRKRGQSQPRSRRNDRSQSKPFGSRFPTDPLQTSGSVQVSSTSQNGSLVARSDTFRDSRPMQRSGLRQGCGPYQSQNSQPGYRTCSSVNQLSPWSKHKESSNENDEKNTPKATPSNGTTKSGTKTAAHGPDGEPHAPTAEKTQENAHTGEEEKVLLATDSKTFFKAMDDQLQRVERRRKKRPRQAYTEEDLTCRECNKRFANIYRLRRHEGSHREDRPFVCDICHKGFKQSGHRNEHRLTHDTSRKRSFLCNHCGVVIGSRSSFRYHLLSHQHFHDNLVGVVHDAALSWENPGVGAAASDARTGSSHQDRSDSPPLPRPLATTTATTVYTAYDCPHCQDRFATAQSLNSHLESHSEVKLRCHVQPFTCEKCGRSFTYRHNLEKHRALHVKPEKYHEMYRRKVEEHIASGKPHFICDVCKKIYLRKETLRKHEKVHTGVKPYRCEYCFKCFTQKIHLTVHLRLHTGSRPFQCRMCQKCFMDSTALARHVEKDTCREEPAPPEKLNRTGRRRAAPKRKAASSKGVCCV